MNNHWIGMLRSDVGYGKPGMVELYRSDGDGFAASGIVEPCYSWMMTEGDLIAANTEVTGACHEGRRYVLNAACRRAG